MRLPKDQVTQALLQEYLDYNPNTGWLVWKKKLGRKVIVGKRAGCKVKGRDNRIIHIFGNVFIEHRLIWLHQYGYYPERYEHIDHINHIEDDNRLCNMRLVSQKENNKNTSLKSTNTTGVIGVWISKVNGAKKYIAEISTDTGSLRKSFYTLEEAAQCRKVWQSQYGYHTNHGIVKPR